MCVCVSALKVGQLSQSGSLMARREDTLFILIFAALGNYVSIQSIIEAAEKTDFSIYS